MKSVISFFLFFPLLAWLFLRAAIETIILGRTAEEQMNGGYDK